MVSLALAGENYSKITKLPSKADRYKLNRFISSHPVRFCAIHTCYPDTPFFRLIKSVYALGMHTSESTRFRLKFHAGTFNNNHILGCIDQQNNQVFDRPSLKAI